MQQTHEALAASIRREFDCRRDDADASAIEARIVLRNIATDAANHFEQSNPRFDRARFMKACGIFG